MAESYPPANDSDRVERKRKINAQARLLSLTPSHLYGPLTPREDSFFAASFADRMASNQ
jgi:hypothetical protein